MLARCRPAGNIITATIEKEIAEKAEQIFKYFFFFFLFKKKKKILIFFHFLDEEDTFAR